MMVVELLARESVPMEADTVELVLWPIWRVPALTVTVLDTVLVP